jgi:hypothetical protein
MRGLGEGYMPAIKPARPWDGVYGADWRVVPGLSGVIPTSMPLMQQVNGMSGMGRMGSLDEGTWQQVWMYVASKMSEADFATIKSIFDGSWAEQLTALKNEMNQKKSAVLAMKENAVTLEQVSAFEEAWKAYLKFEADVLEAISFYNNGIWKIRGMKAYADAFGVGFEAPDYLSGMGVAPVAAIAIIAAAVVAIYMSEAWSESIAAGKLKTVAAFGDLAVLKQFIEAGGGDSGGGFIEQTIANTGNVVKWLAIGAAVYFGAKMVMDAGGLKGLKETFGRKS